MDWLLFARQVLLSDGPLAALIMLIVGNFVLAILAALRAGVFDLKIIGQVFARDILPKIGGYLVLRFLLAEADPFLPTDAVGVLINGAFAALAVGAWHTIVLELVARIGDHLQALGLLPTKAV